MIVDHKKASTVKKKSSREGATSEEEEICLKGKYFTLAPVER